MARLAVILHDGSPGWRELRLSRILDFFGVPWKLVRAPDLGDVVRPRVEYVIMGSIRSIATDLEQRQRTNSTGPPPAAYYGYGDDERSLCASALQSLSGDLNLSLQPAPDDNLAIRISRDLSDLAGPMAGLELSLRLGKEDAFLGVAPTDGPSTLTAVIRAANNPVFVRFQHDGAPVFVCTSSNMVDIDETVSEGFYDIKDHFCSAVPLVMFIKFMFREVAWRAHELGACLIIDDPLLKPQYGFCNFANLRTLMHRYGFTTNIAFIPWNWRRTSPAAGKFFDDGSGEFSVSIHGCDHTAGEFGVTSPEILNARAQLARSRMRNHKSRTGIQHDSVMVFPQGAFSSVCPEILKRNGYLAAVNTEIIPVDSENSKTRIKDVWDVAIMTYDNFPIFTRRYAFHGIENFAFDLLLGKPCLIVAHHDYFRDDGVALIELVERIGSLNSRVRWRPLGEVIRRACRQRDTAAGTEELEMYGNELVIGNPTEQAIEVKICKRKSHNDLAPEILCDEKSLDWTTQGDQFVFGGKIASKSQMCFRVVYREPQTTRKARRSLRFELAVASRRILSEVRDDYLAKSEILSGPAARLKNALKRAN